MVKLYYTLRELSYIPNKGKGAKYFKASYDEIILNV
jgi:hypothetical protein